MLKAVICDIDGTIADLSHRLHYVKGKNHAWDKFFAEVSKDSPIMGVIYALHVLDAVPHNTPARHDIILVSGRSDECKETTVAWLKKHDVPYTSLYMRKAGDYRADHIIKKEILTELKNKYEISYVIDDRPSVVEMWRKEGLTCFVPAQWNDDLAIDRKLGKLYLMVGASGAGKSSYLSSLAKVSGSQIVSTDAIRMGICGDIVDQSKNSQVFNIAYALLKAGIDNGMDMYFDATNLHRKDRMKAVALADEVEYIVVERDIADKLKSRGWRSEELINKHHQRWLSVKKEVLKGDNLDKVKVTHVAPSKKIFI